jgi:hypothetical protein
MTGLQLALSNWVSRFNKATLSVGEMFICQEEATEGVKASSGNQIRHLASVNKIYLISLQLVLK